MSAADMQVVGWPEPASRGGLERVAAQLLRHPEEGGVVDGHGGCLDIDDVRT